MRNFRAWVSIDDSRDELNLDTFQRTQAASKREEADRTVDQRLPETYSWALVPVQRHPTGSVDWDEIRLTGQEPLAVRASRKLRSEEALITEFGAIRLRKELDEIPLWRGDQVGLRQVWDDFAQYLYLPRLRDSHVLIEAVQQGIAMLTWEQDGFAYAEGWDESAGRYQGLRAGEHAAAQLTAEAMLVKPDVARRQLEQERPDVVPPKEGVSPEGEGGEAGSKPPVEPEAEVLRRFHGSVSLDPVRLGRDADQIAEAIVQHLASLPEADVEVTLEVQAKLPEGAPDNVVRTVTENAKTLKFREFGFEKD